MITFSYSYERPEIAPVLAFWSTLEWLRQDLAEISFSERIQRYRDRNDPNKLPVTLVAFDHELPVGMISLKNNDLPTRPDLTPWMASFYVVYEYRNRGIGSSLHDRIISKAEYLGFKVLYLNTYQAAPFYRKRKWVFVDTAICVGGHKGEIYRLDL